MINLQQCIENQVSVSKNELDHISSYFEERILKKGDYFLNSDTICKEMSFIESGYLRMYNVAGGKEITIWISSPGQFITSVASFVFQTTNYWKVQAITPCKLQIIKRDHHFALCAESIKWLEFDNRLLAQSFALLEQNMFGQLYQSAEERFDTLFKENPSIFNNVPLNLIASMLRMTPETLSRLRKKHSSKTS